MKAPNFWKWLHRRKIAKFAERCQVGTVIEHGCGKRFEVTVRGDRGFHYKEIVKDSSKGGGFIALFCDADGPSMSWHTAARYYKIIAGPADQIEEALRAK